MLLSDPTLEFTVPAALTLPGARCWRAMKILPQLPWFIAGFEIIDESGTSGVTMCFAWERDLVSAIRSLDEGKLLNLVVMQPPWQSASGSWEAKPIVAIHREVGPEDVYMFETSDGAHVSAMDSRPVRTRQRLELVVTVPFSA